MNNRKFVDKDLNILQEMDNTMQEPQKTQKQKIYTKLQSQNERRYLEQNEMQKI